MNNRPPKRTPKKHKSATIPENVSSRFIMDGASQSPNDPKLSDGGGWRAGCMVGGKAAAEAASVTAGAVRCSAWLGVAGFGVEVIPELPQFRCDWRVMLCRPRIAKPTSELLVEHSLDIGCGGTRTKPRKNGGNFWVVFVAVDLKVDSDWIVAKEKRLGCCVESGIERFDVLLL